MQTSHLLHENEYCADKNKSLCEFYSGLSNEFMRSRKCWHTKQLMKTSEKYWCNKPSFTVYVVLLIFYIGKKVTSLLPPETLIILSTYSRALSSRPRCHKNKPAKYRACCPAVLRCSFSFASKSRIASRSERVLFRAFVDHISKYYTWAACKPRASKANIVSCIIHWETHRQSGTEIKDLREFLSTWSFVQ